MRTSWTIAQKEIKVFFVSPLFYVVSALFIALYGVFFAYNLISTQQASLRNTFNIALFILLFVAPLLSMRLISQEKQQGTIELLLTNPVRDYEVVLGKFLAAVVMFLATMSFTLVSVLVLVWTSVNRVQVGPFKLGHVDVGPLVAGYLGFILIAAGYLAIGIFASSLTQNQILAAFITFAALLFIIAAGTFSSLFQAPMSDFLSYLGSNSHVDAFGRGVFAVPDILYALSLIGVPLFLAILSLGSRRWH
ncbi:MAG: ABC transporter permease [Candidatus Dormibacteria bacterium]